MDLDAYIREADSKSAKQLLSTPCPDRIRVPAEVSVSSQ